MITVTRFVTGPIETNSYTIVDGSKNCLIIDPSSGCDELIDTIKTGGLATEAVVLTHGHFDHIMGLGEVVEALGPLPVYIHSADRSCLSNPHINGSPMIGVKYSFEGDIRELKEGPMTIGSFAFEVLNIPGHTPGGCVLLIANYCICGDVLFAGSIGRSDLPGGDGAALMAGIKRKLLTLPDGTIVCSGHGSRTTIGREKRANPYLR